MITHRWKTDWRGDAVKKSVDKAAVGATNATLEDAVQRARHDHPGWRDRTGATSAAFGRDPAKADGAHVRGALFNGAPHFIFLEIGFRGRAGDHTLRRALDVAGAKHPERVRDGIGR